MKVCVCVWERLQLRLTLVSVWCVLLSQLYSTASLTPKRKRQLNAYMCTGSRSARLNVSLNKMYHYLVLVLEQSCHLFTGLNNILKEKKPLCLNSHEASPFTGTWNMERCFAECWCVAAAKAMWGKKRRHHQNSHAGQTRSSCWALSPRKHR